ncbi:hypothetical protein BCR36DRAFT_295671 [Piromyces finnis]|uniref:Uncharacterized protein n=1 Tax=Piromyces finnis TaxID=1754191 RepID=A0A1Y1V5S6_9FUNG|nr:hypothetical protein BCR36DRAFT_295671 [Piromyces finnis]|eukprot:ORX47274.1 hypothetical protein BCR36DRAFT_295671 [Piromyces finnis]
MHDLVYSRTDRNVLLNVNPCISMKPLVGLLLKSIEVVVNEKTNSSRDKKLEGNLLENGKDSDKVFMDINMTESPQESASNINIRTEDDSIYNEELTENLSNKNSNYIDTKSNHENVNITKEGKFPKDLVFKSDELQQLYNSISQDLKLIENLTRSHKESTEPISYSNDQSETLFITNQNIEISEFDKENIKLEENGNNINGIMFTDSMSKLYKDIMDNNDLFTESTAGINKTTGDKATYSDTPLKKEINTSSSNDYYLSEVFSYSKSLDSDRYFNYSNKNKHTINGDNKSNNDVTSNTNGIKFHSGPPVILHRNSSLNNKRKVNKIIQTNDDQKETKEKDTESEQFQYAIKLSESDEIDEKSDENLEIIGKIDNINREKVIEKIDDSINNNLLSPLDEIDAIDNKLNNNKIIAKLPMIPKRSTSMSKKSKSSIIFSYNNEYSLSSPTINNNNNNNNSVKDISSNCRNSINDKSNDNYYHEKSFKIESPQIKSVNNEEPRNKLTNDANNSNQNGKDKRNTRDMFNNYKTFSISSFDSDKRHSFDNTNLSRSYDNEIDIYKTPKIKSPRLVESPKLIESQTSNDNSTISSSGAYTSYSYKKHTISPLSIEIPERPKHMVKKKSSKLTNIFKTLSPKSSSSHMGKKYNKNEFDDFPGKVLFDDDSDSDFIQNNTKSKRFSISKLKNKVIKKASKDNYRKNKDLEKVSNNVNKKYRHTIASFNLLSPEMTDHAQEQTLKTETEITPPSVKSNFKNDKNRRISHPSIQRTDLPSSPLIKPEIFKKNNNSVSSFKIVKHDIDENEVKQCAFNGINGILKNELIDNQEEGLYIEEDEWIDESKYDINNKSNTRKDKRKKKIKNYIRGKNQKKGNLNKERNNKKLIDTQNSILNRNASKGIKRNISQGSIHYTRSTKKYTVIKSRPTLLSERSKGSVRILEQNSFKNKIQTNTSPDIHNQSIVIVEPPLLSPNHSHSLSKTDMSFSSVVSRNSSVKMKRNVVKRFLHINLKKRQNKQSSNKTIRNTIKNNS